MHTPLRPAHVRQPLPQWVIWALLFIVLLALGTDLIFFTGFCAVDDLQYLKAAQQIASSRHLTYIMPGTTRLGLILPIAFVIKVTDHNLFLTAAMFVFYHLLVVVGTYWLGSLIHGRHTGVLAAGLMAVCPLATLNATIIQPDLLGTALATLSAACLLAGRARLAPTPSQARSTWALFCLAGILFTCALSAKEIAIILPPVFLLVIASCLRRAPARAVLRAVLLFVLGAGIAALALWVAFYSITGLRSPFENARWVSMVSSIHEYVEARLSNSPADRLKVLVGYATDKNYLGLFTWAPLLALVGYPLVRGRSWGLYAAFIYLCAYMTWGTFSLTQYVPPEMQLRYFLFAFPSMMVIAAFVIVTVLRPIWASFADRTAARRTLIGLAAILCGILLVNSYGTLNRLAGKRYFTRYFHATRQAMDCIGQLEDRPIALSFWLSVRFAPVFNSPEMARALPTGSTTTVEDVTGRLDSGSFYYIDSNIERLSGRYWLQPSPLDEEVRAALAGQKSHVTVRTIGSFGQFNTRLAALQYIYGGSADCTDLREPERLVFVREVTLLPGTNPD